MKLNKHLKGKYKEVEKKLNTKSDFKLYELILFGFLIMIFSVFITVVITHEILTGKSFNGNISISNSDKMKDFEEVYNLVNSSYYKDVNQTDLIDGAINGMLSSLKDPHTSYFNKQETENFNELMSGSFAGVGLEITSDEDQNILVVSVFKNSPAEEVGIKFNDIIIEVNGKSTKGLSTTEVVNLIKDPEKEIATIKVNRNGEVYKFEVEKREVVIESVESKTFEKNGKKIGYIIINSFANNTYEQFKEQLELLEKNKLEGLIIDVRGNSGGYLHSVTDIIDMFIPKDKVIYQIQDKNKTEKFYSKTEESRNYPLAVLVNKASASASEILAISLKETYGAEVIGTYTYGKGTVQTTHMLSNGSMIKYTIQKWLSPNGEWINDKGVEPTKFIEISEEYQQDRKEKNDNQLQEALQIISKK